MKKRNALKFVHNIAIELKQVVKQLDLSDVDNADALLRGIEMILTVLDTYSETSRKELAKTLGEILLSDFTPTKPRIDQNRIVQHLWSNASLAVKDSINPEGSLPIDFSNEELAVFSMLMGDDQVFDVLMEMGPTEKDGYVPQFIPDPGNLEPVPTSETNICDGITRPPKFSGVEASATGRE